MNERSCEPQVRGFVAAPMVRRAADPGSTCQCGCTLTRWVHPSERLQNTRGARARGPRGRSGVEIIFFLARSAVGVNELYIVNLNRRQ
jgi:hypothetical protein